MNTKKIMKTGAAVICAVILCLLPSRAEALFAPVEEADGRVALMRFTEEDVVLWVDPERRSEAIGEFGFDEKSPDGEPAVTYEIIENLKAKFGARGHVYTEEDREEWPWRDNEFLAISFWVRGYSSEGRLELDIYEDGNPDPYVYRFSPEVGWQHKMIPLYEFEDTSGAGGTVDISNLAFLHFVSRRKIKVSFGGAVRLELTRAPKPAAIMLMDSGGISTNAQFDGICLRRISDGEFKVTGMLDSEPFAAEEAELFAEITNPEGAKYSQTTSLAISAERQYFSTTVHCLPESEGEHWLTLKLSGLSGTTWRAFRFQYFFPAFYGKIVINPRPKQVEWGEGFLNLDADPKIYIPETASARAEKTAVYLADELYGFFGRTFEVTRVPALPEQGGISMLVDAGLSADIPAEGYTLAVNDGGVLLKGVDEAGLYYAAVTLMQIARGPMQITGAPLIRKTEITDWPDLEYRLCDIDIGWWRRKTDLPIPVDLNWFKDYIKTAIAGQKLNMMVFGAIGGFIFEHNTRLQALKHQKDLIWTKAQQQEIAAFCKEHFVEFVPQIRSANNIHWVPRSEYPEFYASLSNHKKGDPTALDPDDPDATINPEGPTSTDYYYTVLLPAVDEIIEGTGCKYVHIGHDEWWTNLPAEDYPDEYFKKWTDENGVEQRLAAREVFLADVKILYEHLENKGIRTMMHADMILKNHNGDGTGLFSEHYTIAPRIPKDIIMTNWSNTVDSGSNKELYDHGFEVICAGNGFIPCAKDSNILSGFGNLAYGASHMMSGLVNDRHALQYGYTTLLRSADYAWNVKNDPGVSIEEFEESRMANIGAVNSIKPNPKAGSGLQPISITGTANADLEGITGIELAEYPSGLGDFGFIPMELIAPEEVGGSVIALPPGGEPVEVAVSEKASALYFLHAFYAPPENRTALFLRGNTYLFGAPMITYTITYDDGTSEESNAGFGFNILDVVPAFSRSKFMSDIRYSWTGNTVEGRPACLYQHEWVNPFPEKTIKSLSLASAGPEATPIVFAITARDVAPPPPLEGDVNKDSRVDILDLLAVARKFGTSPGGPPYDEADLNQDRDINILDLLIVARNFGAVAP